MTESARILVPLGIGALLMASCVWLDRSDGFKRSKNKTVRLLGNIGEYIARGVIICFLGPLFLATVCALGILVLSLSSWIIGLFSEHLAKSLEHALLPDWPFHLGLVIPTAAGALTILCGSRISRVWKRKRAIEEEIKIVSNIQVVEPLPPSRVERFFGVDGAIDRLYNRYFGWIEKIESDRLRRAVGWLIFCVIAFPLGRIAIWAQGIRLESYLAKIFLPLFFGYLYILLAIFVGGVVYYAWLAARSIIKWVAQNLPRGLVFRYRLWKLRHGLVKRRRLEWLTAVVATALIIVAVAGLKACQHAPDGEDESEQAEESPSAP